MYSDHSAPAATAEYDFLAFGRTDPAASVDRALNWCYSLIKIELLLDYIHDRLYETRRNKEAAYVVHD